MLKLVVRICWVTVSYFFSQSVNICSDLGKKLNLWPFFVFLCYSNQKKTFFSVGVFATKSDWHATLSDLIAPSVRLFLWNKTEKKGKTWHDRSMTITHFSRNIPHHFPLVFLWILQNREDTIPKEVSTNRKFKALVCVSFGVVIELGEGEKREKEAGRVKSILEIASDISPGSRWLGAHETTSTYAFSDKNLWPGSTFRPKGTDESSGRTAGKAHEKDHVTNILSRDMETHFHLKPSARDLRMNFLGQWKQFFEVKQVIFAISS